MNKIETLIAGNSFPDFHTSVYLITTKEDKKILFDTGFPYDTKQLLASLESRNISPADIDTVIISHWHIDHVGSISHFQSARLLISDDSMSTVREIMGYIEKAKTQESPIDYLVNVLDDEGGWDKEIGKNQKRAMANFAYRNKHLWETIAGWEEEKIIIVDTSPYSFEGIEIEKAAIHTDGDLVARVKNRAGKTLFVGDIFPTENYLAGRNENLLKGCELKLYRETRKPGVSIGPGHGEIFSAS